MSLWGKTGNVLMQRMFSGFAPKPDMRMTTCPADIIRYGQSHPQIH
jgi:hypothetical protein